jgi:chromate transporter
MSTRGNDTRHLVPLSEAARAWFQISLQTFGGPAGQIAVMQRTLVDERGWIGERRFLHALSYCMLLPGPEAHQLAIYIGWLLNGSLGGIIAGVLFVVPGVLAILALSWAYVAHGDTTLVTGLFAGLAPAVVAVVAHALVRVGRRALRPRVLVAIAVAAFVALAVFAVPFPVVVAAAAVVGWWLGRGLSGGLGSAHEPTDGSDRALVADGQEARRGRSWRRTVAMLSVGVVLWLAPVALVVELTDGGTLADQGTFFAGTALVTFGGAYAVLAYVAQRAVETYGWLTAGEMVKGLALAETTPGPLIMVVQFVAFVGAYRAPGGLDPWVAAVLGSLLTVWVTFVPSFLFVFSGAPYVERLRDNRRLADALAGITAAVVGVIANLAVYFAVHTLFERTTEWARGPVRMTLPIWESVSWSAWLVAAIAGGLLFGLRWPVLRTLGVCAALGVVLTIGG